MKLVRTFYYHNTNHGGSCGNREESMYQGEHLLPLMRLFQRRFMWFCGFGDKYFEEKDDEIRYPKEGQPPPAEEPPEVPNPWVGYVPAGGGAGIDFGVPFGDAGSGDEEGGDDGDDDGHERLFGEF